MRISGVKHRYCLSRSVGKRCVLQYFPGISWPLCPVAHVPCQKDLILYCKSITNIHSVLYFKIYVEITSASTCSWFRASSLVCVFLPSLVNINSPPPDPYSTVSQFSLPFMVLHSLVDVKCIYCTAVMSKLALYSCKCEVKIVLLSDKSLC